MLDVLDDSVDELVEVAVKMAEEGENMEELRKEDEEAITMLWADVWDKDATEEVNEDEIVDGTREEASVDVMMETEVRRALFLEDEEVVGDAKVAAEVRVPEICCLDSEEARAVTVDVSTKVEAPSKGEKELIP